MKRIEFIAPVESMRGNLSGAQVLDYRENNNPAYEAPDGDAHALNYQPRFVGAKRAKDGLKYFAVRTKSTTKLNAKTRMAMAILGVVAAMKSALKTLHAADWAKLQQAYAYQVEHGISVPDTFDKWIDREFGTMLRYGQEKVQYVMASINVAVYNPYADHASALVISNRIWVKFLNVFKSGLDAFYISIDSASFLVMNGITWEGLLDPTATENPNMRASYAGITIASAGANPMYMGHSIYDEAGVIQTSETELVADTKYTTIAPNP